MIFEILYLGVSDESNANGEFPLHATREGLRTRLPLVLEAQDTDDPVHLIWNLVFGVTFQLRQGNYRLQTGIHSLLMVNIKPGIKCFV